MVDGCSLLLTYTGIDGKIMQLPRLVFGVRHISYIKLLNYKQRGARKFSKDNEAIFSFLKSYSYCHRTVYSIWWPANS